MNRQQSRFQCVPTGLFLFTVVTVFRRFATFVHLDNPSVTVVTVEIFVRNVADPLVTPMHTEREPCNPYTLLVPNQRNHDHSGRYIVGVGWLNDPLTGRKKIRKQCEIGQNEMVAAQGTLKGGCVFGDVVVLHPVKRFGEASGRGCAWTEVVGAEGGRFDWAGRRR